MAWDFTRFCAKVRAVTTTRLATPADAPALADFVPGFEASSWQGIGAPRDTSSSNTSPSFCSAFSRWRFNSCTVSAPRFSILTR